MAGIPNAIRLKFQDIIENSKGDERFKKMLATGSDENFKWAYQFAYERAFGKPMQSVDMELTDVSDRPSAEQLRKALRVINPGSEGDSKSGNGVAA